jgi:hypothetical protein
LRCIKEAVFLLCSNAWQELAGTTVGYAMYEHQVELPRDSFMEAAQREMIAFELREREFSKELKKDRAEELHMPALKN